MQLFERQRREDVDLSFAPDLPASATADEVESDDDGLGIAPDLEGARGKGAGKSPLLDWSDDDADSGSIHIAKSISIVDLSSDDDTGDAARSAPAARRRKVAPTGAGKKRKEPAKDSSATESAVGGAAPAKRVKRTVSKPPTRVRPAVPEAEE